MVLLILPHDIPLKPFVTRRNVIPFLREKPVASRVSRVIANHHALLFSTVRVAANLIIDANSVLLYVWPHCRNPFPVVPRYKGLASGFLWSPIALAIIAACFCHPLRFLLSLPVVLINTVTVLLGAGVRRSEEHTSELQSHSFISYAV